MDQISIELGTRIVQENHGAHMINIPNTAVRVLNIKAGDTMRWDITNGELKIKCMDKEMANEHTR